MKRIITSDPHFTDRPQDEYRFDLFPFLKEQAKKLKVDYIDILGDLTDLDDRHSSILVNRLVDELCELAKVVDGVNILKGNHDYKDPDNPFFEFLTDIPKLVFIKEPTMIGDAFYLPHTRDVASIDESAYYINKADIVFMHQTVNGAVASNGHELPGMSPAIFKKTKARIYSGDIHVPQKLGKITYVGSPYTVHFNDTFAPRILVLDNNIEENIYLDTIMRWTLEVTNVQEIYEADLLEGDQVKIRMKLPQEEAVHWPNYRKEIREACEKQHLEVFGIKLIIEKRKSKRVRLDIPNEQQRISRDPKKVLAGFCRKNSVPKNLRSVGMELL